jgi:hypothetical protein
MKAQNIGTIKLRCSLTGPALDGGTRESALSMALVPKRILAIERGREVEALSSVASRDGCARYGNVTSIGYAPVIPV